MFYRLSEGEVTRKARLCQCALRPRRGGAADVRVGRDRVRELLPVGLAPHALDVGEQELHRVVAVERGGGGSQALFGFAPERALGMVAGEGGEREGRPFGLVTGGVDLGEPVQALRGGVGLGVVGEDALQPRLGSLQVPDPEIVSGDVRLVLGERLAALAHAEARPLRPRALREAVDQVAEVGERIGMRLLVAIAGARLGEVRHAEVVLDRGQLRAGRVHALEVAEGSDRLGPALCLVVRERDLQLRLLGVLVEGVLVEELLVAVDGELVCLDVESVLRLAPELLGRDDRFLAGAPERDERDGERADQAARHGGGTVLEAFPAVNSFPQSIQREAAGTTMCWRSRSAVARSTSVSTRVSANSIAVPAPRLVMTGPSATTASSR